MYININNVVEYTEVESKHLYYYFIDKKNTSSRTLFEFAYIFPFQENH